LDINKIRAQDPESADIYQDVQDALRRILARRAELDAAGLADVPLFLAIGETHSCSAHLLHNSLLLQALATHEESIAVGMEYAHNFLEAATGAPRHNISDKEYGEQTLTHAVEKSSSDYADLANRFFMHTMLHHSQGLDGFAAIFNDAASRDMYLDFSDDATFNVYKMFFETAQRNDAVHVISPEGAFIRNVFMADRLKTLAEKQKARFAIQFCGHSHVSGNKYWPAENSLAGCFDQMNAPFMALYMPHDEVTADLDVLDDAYKIISARVPAVKTFYSAKTGTLDPNIAEDKKILDEERPDITSRAAEQAFINSKLEHMGMADQKVYFKATPQ
jgi:hypothetical protein|tara:strand:+ start:182820 stop:183818 length:999 start_codon:yes stop_codon:yes gene_type:complete